MKKILIPLLLLISFLDARAQFNPTSHIIINDALGQQQSAPIEGRGMFWDQINFRWRDFQNTSEALSTLPTNSNRFSHFPIWIHVGGSLSGGVWTGGISQAWFFKDGLADGNLVRWYTDTTILRPAQDSMWRLTDSTIAFTINGGSLRTVLVRGTAAGGISSLQLNTPSIFNTPVNFTNTGGAWSGTLNLTNQNASFIWAGPTAGAPAQPTFRQMVTGDLPLNIPNGNLANSSIATIMDNTGTVPGFGTSSVPLGGTLLFHNPVSSATTSGYLTSTDWIRFNNAAIGQVTSVNGQVGAVITLNADSIWNYPIDITNYRNGWVLSLDTVNSKLKFSPPSSGSGITNLNGLTTTTQSFSLGNSGTSPNIASSGSTHTFNIPIVNGADSGIVTPGLFNLWNAKQTALIGTGYLKFSGTIPSYLTPTQVTADLNLFSSTLQGLVPLSGGGTTNFLRSDGTWASPPGGAGNTNSNVGIGYRWAVPTTNNIKTVFGSLIIIDSTTNANALTLTADTTTGDQKLATQGFITRQGFVTASGNLSPLFTSAIAAGSISFTLSNAAANTVFGNFTGSSAAPGFGKVNLASMATNTANTLLGYNGSGNPSDITLTTTGSSGPATISAGVLNIPQYSGGGSQTFPQVLATGRTFIAADSVLMAANNFKYVFTSGVGTGSFGKFISYVSPNVGAEPKLFNDQAGQLIGNRFYLGDTSVNQPTFMEFGEFPSWGGNSRGFAGVVGSPEFNWGLNLNYRGGIHHPYDSTQDMIYGFLGSNGFGLQAAGKGHITSGDYWNQFGIVPWRVDYFKSGNDFTGSKTTTNVLQLYETASTNQNMTTGNGASFGVSAALGGSYSTNTRNRFQWTGLGLTGSSIEQYFLAQRPGGTPYLLTANDTMMVLNTNTTGYLMFRASADAPGNFTSPDLQLRLQNASGTLTNRFSVLHTGFVGINTFVPAHSLDIIGTDAILLPNGNTAQRSANLAGLLRYNSDSTKLEYNTGSGWVSLSAAGGGITSWQQLLGISPAFTANASQDLATFAFSFTKGASLAVSYTYGQYTYLGGAGVNMRITDTSTGGHNFDLSVNGNAAQLGGTVTSVGSVKPFAIFDAASTDIANYGFNAGKARFAIPTANALTDPYVIFGANTTGSMLAIFNTASDSRPYAFRINNNGNAAFGLLTATAQIHIAAGSATAGRAPLKFTSGTVLTTPEIGAIEFNSGLFMGDSSNSVRDTFATRSWARNNITGGGGAVSSVSNSDGTLTISPTTGAVIASLALGHANTWTGKQTQPAPIFTGTTSAGANDSVMTIDPATGQTHWRTGIFNLYPANGLSISTVVADSIYWGGTLNQATNIAGAGFGVSIGTSGSHLGSFAVYSDGGSIFNNGKYQSAQGSQILGAASTINNAVTSANGTVANFSAYAFLAPTVTSTNASITYTNPATLRIDNSPTMSTNSTASGLSYALDVAAGISHFGVGSANISALFSGCVALGGATNTNTQSLSIGAPTTTSVSLNLAPAADPTSGGVLSNPGNMWFNGTNLFFVDGGTQRRDILNGIHNYLHTIFIPTAASTTTLIVNQYNIINPGSGGLSFTLNLPSSPNNNDIVYIKFDQTATVVTYGGGTIVGGIASPVAGQIVMFVYDSGTSTWY